MTTEIITVLRECMAAAIKVQHKAAKELALVKISLDLQRNKIIAAGVEGKNTAERDANTELALASETQAFNAAKFELDEANLSVALARLEWDAMRYELRLLEVLKH
jgi:hypothetical protein